MCPRCESRARKHPTDPEYIYCYLCGDVPAPGIVRMSYLRSNDPVMPRATNTAYQLSTCADCGAEIEARSKRCKNCAGKGVKAL